MLVIVIQALANRIGLMLTFPHKRVKTVFASAGGHVIHNPRHFKEWCRET